MDAAFKRPFFDSLGSEAHEKRETDAVDGKRGDI
jgi:hypothetical protein